MFTDIASLAFFAAVRDFFRGELKYFTVDATAGMVSFMAMMAFTLITIWILSNGYRIMTGQSKEPLLAFMVNATRIMVIVSIATNTTLYNDVVRDNFYNVRDAINYAITGSDGDVYDKIDRNLAKTQIIITGVNAITTGIDQAGSNQDSDKSLILWSSAFGSGAPAIVAGTVCLLNEIALSLAIVFGPFFMICFIFEQTKPLFWNWIKYVIGVSASMVILSVMSSFALEISFVYAKAMIAGAFLDVLASDITGGGNAQSLSATAMTLGGLGLLLSTLLITVPPMAMQFFSVSLGGSVSGWSAFTSAAKGLGGATGSPAAPAPGIPQNTDTKEPSLNTGQINSNQSNQQSQQIGNSGWDNVRTDPQRGLGTTSSGNLYKPSDNAVIDWMRQNRADGGMFGTPKPAAPPKPPTKSE